jgi:hypothetical protein
MFGKTRIMNALKPAAISLKLSIILWGILLGGIVYSHLVFFRVYLSDLPQSAIIVTGPYGLHEGIFWAVIHPVLILSLIVSLVLNWKYHWRRLLILIPIVVYAVMLIVSTLYFVPELYAFADSARSTVTPAEWLARGQRWQRLSWLRGFVMFLCFLPLLLALESPLPAPEIEPDPLEL